MATFSTILDDADFTELRRNGLAWTLDGDGPSAPGRIRASCRALHSSSDDAYDEPPPQPGATMDIPMILHSRETLERIGLRSEAATRTWDAWMSSSPEVRDYNGFLNFATTRIRYHPGNAFSLNSDKEWRSVLHAYGCSDKMIQLIMNPEFTDIRHCESAKQWVLITFTLRFRTLQSLASNSRKRADQHRRRHSEEPPGPDV